MILNPETGLLATWSTLPLVLSLISGITAVAVADENNVGDYKPTSNQAQLSQLPNDSWIMDYGVIDGVYIGMNYNPVLISTLSFDNYLVFDNTGDEEFKQSFLNGADWLVNNAVDHGNYSILEYHFPWSQYNLTSPWQSGMAQGLGAKTLLRAYQVTEDEKYLEVARKLINSFFVEVRDGGVTYKSDKDGWWYEGYAGVGGKQPRVLNGMMYSLLGIYDYYKYTNDSKAKYLFDQGVLSLRKNLYRYDLSQYFYSYFDIFKTNNSLDFHRDSITLLKKIYELTHDDLFKSFSNRWDEYKIPELVDKAPSIIVNPAGQTIVNYGKEIGMQINPVTVSHIALDNFSNYEISGSEDAKQSFLNGADWLVNNAVDHGNYSILEYHFPWSQYNLTSPWQSGMAQGLGAKTLLRAYQVTEDEKYLEAARKLINSFFVEVRDGGVTYKSDKDGWWYELYAGPGGKQPRVLNGMMYSLLGIYDYYKYTNDSKAKYLFDQGVLSLKRALPMYEYEGNYSNYDILGTTNSLGYHKLHIRLLWQLYNIVDDPVFLSFSEKWSNYTPPYFLKGQRCVLNC